MDNYRHILVAVDLSPEAGAVLARARDVAARHGARLSLVHVVEPIIADPGYDFIPALPDDVETSLINRARQFLDSLQDEAAPVDAHVLVGSVKGEVLRYAQEQGVDLIVLGTHGRHGVSLLLGSTANAVLHGTPCDVLAVRIGEA